MLSAPKFTTTGADGKFSFSNLVPSVTPYEVSEVADETVGKNRYFTDTNKADDFAAVGKAIPDWSRACGSISPLGNLR